MEAEMQQHNQEHSKESSEEIRDEYHGLTDRQKQIYLCYLRLGMPSKVSTELGLSKDHVKKTLASIRSKLNIAPLGASTTQRKQSSKETAKGKLLQLIENQGYKCALSRIDLTPFNAVIDHKIPVADGGTNDAENLQWLHKDINRMKNTLSQERFISLCLMVAKAR